ncbi:MAG TPA: DUF192 domain-containing protein [Candidatus Moranbacteria bacterium]|nr:DUF192 domain-containing protein [Candidatus Moranbacteria bacterium]
MQINLRLRDKIFLAILAVMLLLFMVQKITSFGKPEEAKKNDLVVVEIGEKATLQVLVADTPQKQFQGLSGVEQLDSNKGMLFVHENLGRRAYVMREMKIDLDFIFIRDDQVVDMAKNIAREYQGEIAGEADYNFVLEVNSGWISQNDIQLGDRVKISGLSENN